MRLWHRVVVDRPASLRQLPWHATHRWLGRAVSEGRRLVIKATHRHCRVEFRGPVFLGPGFALNIPDHGTFIVGSGVDFRRGFVCEISGDGRVEIGDGCTFTSHALIQCSTSIVIDQGCTFGQSLSMVDGRHLFRDPDVHVLAHGYDFKPLHIEQDVTVMGKCTIAANIGRRAVIGAHSLVTRDIPDYTLAVGAPAQPIEYFGHGEPPPGVPRSRPERVPGTGTGAIDSGAAEGK